MSNTGLDTFDTTIQETNSLLKEIETALGWQGKRRRTYDVLRAVLQTLRDRMTIEETAQFAAQLPMLVRGVFYEGWDPTDVPTKMDKDIFLLRIGAESGLEESDDVEHITRVVFQALKSYVNAGEVEDVKSVLPRDIASMI